MRKGDWEMSNELDKYMLGQELIDGDHKELFKLVYKSYDIILSKENLSSIIS